MQDRYPDADILGQRGHWDEATRDVVLDRVHNVPEYHFFDAHERETLNTLCELVIPQDWKPAQRRVPIAPWIDQRCQEGYIDGFRYDDMPDEPRGWRLGLAGLDEVAQALHQRPFHELTLDQQRSVVDAVDGGHPPGDSWKELPAQRWWRYIALRQIAGVYYAHPFAWDEIGFGGPAYPRGYAALNHGAPEPWEPREVGEERQ